MKIQKTVLFLVFVMGFTIGLLAQSGQNSNSGSYSQDSRTVRVPAGNGKIVALDGIFSEGEWEDAVHFPISDRHEIYLMADAENLFLGLKSVAPVGMMLSDILFTSNEKTFANLHSSAALGEGVGTFPSTLRESKFDVGKAVDWGANIDKMDKVKEEAWITQGKKREKYDEIFIKKDGKEYRIGLKKIAGPRLKMVARIIDVKGLVNFPPNGNLASCDGWLELILPEIQK